MNIYDTKCVSCVKCGKSIGEIEFDAEVTIPKCGACTNPLPEIDDDIYSVKNYHNSKSNNPQKTHLLEHCLTKD